MTQFGAAALLVGLVLLATHTGSQSFAAIAARSAHLPAWVRGSAFVLAVVGFGSKAGMVPLHVWLPRAHPEAPGPVSALMSAAMVNLGIYGIVRVGDGLLGGGPVWWWLLVMSLGALSALFGSLHSATSSDVKRLLAYSTTDNVGLMLLGVGASGLFASTGHRALALVALVAALLHVVFHAVFKGSLFLSASSLQQATGTRDLDRMGGLLRRMPVTGTIFLVGGLAMAAMPVLCGFVSEWLLLQAMLHGLPSSDPAIAVAMPIGVGALALTGGLTALTIVKAAGIGCSGQPRSTGAVAEAHEVGAVDEGRGRHAGHALPGLRRSPVPGRSRPWSRPPATSPGPASPIRWWGAGRLVWPASTACSLPASSRWASSRLSPWSPGLVVLSNGRRYGAPRRGDAGGSSKPHAWSTPPRPSVSR
jgi:hydrogenase-4 component B